MSPEIAKALRFSRISELEKMNTPKQINVVISTKVSDDRSAKQKVEEALASLYSITYNELTDDIWQAIKLLQKCSKE
jgi:ribosomal protein L5